MATCRKLVEGGAVAFPCSLDLPEGHAGPCEAREKPSSIAARQRWLEENYPRESGYVEPRPISEFMVEPGSISPVPQTKAQKAMPPEVPWDAPMPQLVDVTSEITNPERLPLNNDVRRRFGLGEPEAVGAGLSAYEPPPVAGDGDMWAEVISDMTERREFGLAKYGTPLQRWNGRNASVDAYQEVLDLIVYLRQAVTEQSTVRTRLEVIRADLVANGHDATARENLIEALDDIMRMLPSL
jgi:hypothetical protein